MLIFLEKRLVTFVLSWRSQDVETDRRPAFHGEGGVERSIENARKCFPERLSQEIFNLATKAIFS